MKVYTTQKEKQAQELENKNNLLARRKRQYQDILLQFKMARILLLCLSCILLVFLLLGSGILRRIYGLVIVFVAIAIVIIFLFGYFGTIIFGAKFCKTMGKSTGGAFLLTFATFGVYALYWVIRFYIKNDKKACEEEIAALEKELEEIQEE